MADQSRNSGRWPPPNTHRDRCSSLEKVRRRAYAITDRDVAELKAAGASEDEIFEATVAVATEEAVAWSELPEFLGGPSETASETARRAAEE